MPDKTPPDWKAIERSKWLQLRNNVANEVNKNLPRIRKVASTFANRFGYALDDVLRKIQADGMFAAVFTKQPGRTKLHEQTAIKWIASLAEVSAFETLPQTGSLAIKVDSDGNLRTGVDGKNLPGKSLDFKCETGGKTCYAMHKYSKETAAARRTINLMRYWSL